VGRQRQQSSLVLNQMTGEFFEICVQRLTPNYTRPQKKLMMIYLVSIK
jgi:hypothetical protein